MRPTGGKCYPLMLLFFERTAFTYLDVSDYRSARQAFIQVKKGLSEEA